MPEDHAQLQSRLIALGHFDGEPDGEFGPLTREAIKRFQMQSGEPVSDFVTPAQRARLSDSLAPTAPIIAGPGLSTSVDAGSPPAETERQCQSNDTDKRLAGCTTIINAQGKGYGVALADAYDGRCRSYNDLGRYQLAAEDCKAAIRANGNHSYAYNNLAAALDRLGDTEGAITAYSKSIALKSNFIYSYLGRAYIFIRLGDKVRAKSDLDKVLSIDPDNNNARDAITSLQIDTPNLKSARFFLEDAQAFVAEQNPAPPSISQIATAAAALQIAITKFDEKEATEAKLRLDGLLNSMTGFREFLRVRQGERDRIDGRRLAASIIQANKHLFFVDNYIKKHLLDVKSGPLLRLREQINAALIGKNNDDLDRAIDVIRAFIQNNQLSKEYQIILDSYPTRAGFETTDAFNALLTEETQLVLRGSETDMVFLYNATASAPSIFKNIDGKFIFQTGKASVCFAQPHIDADRRWFLDRNISRQGGISEVHDSVPCDLSRIRTAIDIIAFQRDELLKQDTNYVTTLLNLIQADAVREYAVVSEIAYAENLKNMLAWSDRIASEVENDLAKGFGVLIVNDNASSVCLVAPDKTALAGLKHLLQGEGSTISRRPGFENHILDRPSVESAFEALTKEQCGYVAGNAGTLRKLLLALRRDGRKPTFAALWFSDEAVRAAANSLEAQRQETEERDKMNAASRKQQEVQKQSVQADLRKQYGPRAIGLRDRLQELIKRTADKPLDGSLRRAEETEGTLPKFSNWLNKRFDDQWETTEVRSEVDDYGSVQWKDRNLEGVIVRTTISQKNAIQGARHTECFLFGFVEDVEFSMSRDMFDVDCDRSNNIVAGWKARRQFKSLWRAP